MQKRAMNDAGGVAEGFRALARGVVANGYPDMGAAALKSTVMKADRGLTVCLARNPLEVLEAQQLRHSVFSAEYGVNLGSNGIDHDVFDAYCDHLLVRDTLTNEVVGTYRMLSPHGAKQLRCWYSENEFS